MDAPRRWVESVAVANGRIIFAPKVARTESAGRRYVTVIWPWMRVRGGRGQKASADFADSH
jgi:hypothetical protein